MDIAWLGEGTVRVGFIIDGNFILCHKFNHANLIPSTYITTASLPLRYEITNTGVTASSSTLKQVCSTVISEGGYELRGAQQAVGTPITSPTSLAVAGTYYPVVSIKLKTTRLDGVVILTAISIMGVHLTERCNLSCTHCYQTGAGTGEMSLSDIRALLAELSDMLQAGQMPMRWSFPPV